jgi:hypothetical protein
MRRRSSTVLAMERSSLRSWLYTIATNTCLTQIEKRPKRVLPLDYGPAADPHTPPGEPVVESVWLEPYPDETLGLQDGYAAPAARYEQREGVELAFVAARYVDAWERDDVAAFVAMLTEDASFAMPPLATWYATREGIATWAQLAPLSDAWRWRTVLTRANGQPALAFYAWDEQAQACLPFALNMLTFRGTLISNVTAFIVRSTEASEPEAYQRFPEQPFDAQRLAVAFERFGLPERLA